ncbi:O-antigen ligase family protein [Formosa sp. S-31]|uniref:O-antigen ligase family protein n=1 Tax=Formosa sp. S-31 TaxID=2790949 RepID=UPI003EB9E3C2
MSNTIESSPIMDKLKYAVSFLVAFTLPMFMRLNNIVLGVYIVILLCDSIIYKRKIISITGIKQAIPVVVFFILAFGSALDFEKILVLKYLEKYWSLLLMPMLFLGQENGYETYKLKLFKGLVYGCFVTLLICNFNVIYEIISHNEPVNYFFRWRHLGHEFSKIADTHPAYLGLFICMSLYCILNKIVDFNRIVKLVLLAGFTIGMFQLASRVALLIYIIVWCIFFIKLLRREFKWVIPVAIVFITVISVFFTFGSEYLKDRVFSYDSVMKDDRFERWGVSYEIFLEHPFLGVGFKDITNERVLKYQEKGYMVAAKREYNAHNQFFEYLSLNGIVGGIVYILSFGYLLAVAVKKKQYVFIFLFGSFFVANLTESMMVRIQGIEYFALFGSLFISKFNYKNALR